MMNRLARIVLPAAFALAAGLRGDPIPVKVAVVVTFEVGADKGDTPGEFQYWVERENWTQSIAVPGVDHPGPHGRERDARHRLRHDGARLEPDHGACPLRQVRLLEDLLDRERHRRGEPGDGVHRERRLGALRHRRRRRLRDRREGGGSLLALRHHGRRLQGPEREAEARGLGAGQDGLPPEPLPRRLGVRPHEGHAHPRLGRHEGVPGDLRRLSERPEAAVRAHRGDLRLLPVLARQGDDAVGGRLDPPLDGREGGVRDVRHGGPGDRGRAPAPRTAWATSTSSASSSFGPRATTACRPRSRT